MCGRGPWLLDPASEQTTAHLEADDGHCENHDCGPQSGSRRDESGNACHIRCCANGCGCGGLLHAAREQPASNLEPDDGHGENYDGGPQRGSVAQQVCDV